MTSLNVICDKRFDPMKPDSHMPPANLTGYQDGKDACLYQIDYRTACGCEGYCPPHTRAPTMAPTQQPTNKPTMNPTNMPTMKPTDQPTTMPTWKPSRTPTSKPTDCP